MNKDVDVKPHEYRKLAPPDNQKWFPLPKDYPELTRSGQKAARMAVLHKQDSPLQMVMAWDLFRRLYLMTTEPGYFYHNFAPSPPFHYEAVHDLGAYARNILAAPRGSAKSIVMGTEIPIFLLLTRPYFRLVLCLSTDREIERRFATIMRQLEDNPMIREDFGVLKPPRGKAIWNHHHLEPTNGSRMVGFSVTGRKRGARPDLFLLDDPEYDPESESSSLMMKEKFETFLFKQVIPMLEAGSGMFWIGTMISRRSFLYHACHGDDPRFKFWNIKVLKAISHDNRGFTRVLWDGKWSEEVLESRRLEMGNAAFSTEFLNEPSSEEDRILHIDSKKNEYAIDGPLGKEPLLSPSMITYHSYDKDAGGLWRQTITESGSLFRQMFRLMTFDPARGLTQHHDYSAIAILGIDKTNCLWVLDMWMGRAKDAQILQILYDMGTRWEPRVLGIESVGMQIQIIDSVTTFLQDRKRGGWVPRVVPVDYSGMKGPKSKPDRIATLEWRFPSGKIKYPGHLRSKWPFSALYAQTLDFTYDLMLLPFDDAIDVVSMGHYVVHGKGLRGPEGPKNLSLAEMLRSGQTEKAGVPIITGYNAEDLNEEVLEALVEKATGTGNVRRSQRHIDRKSPYLGKQRGVRRP